MRFFEVFSCLPLYLVVCLLVTASEVLSMSHHTRQHPAKTNSFDACTGYTCTRLSYSCCFLATRLCAFTHRFSLLKLIFVIIFQNASPREMFEDIRLQNADVLWCVFESRNVPIRWISRTVLLWWYTSTPQRINHQHQRQKRDSVLQYFSMLCNSFGLLVLNTYTWNCIF